MQGCPWCDQLKGQLSENNISYVEKDVNENSDLYNKFVEVTGNDLLPSVLIGKNALVPEKSFKTIEECVSTTKRILSEHDQ
jgi:glutaredoxin